MGRFECRVNRHMEIAEHDIRFVRFRHARPVLVGQRAAYGRFVCQNNDLAGNLELDAHVVAVTGSPMSMWHLDQNAATLQSWMETFQGFDSLPNQLPEVLSRTNVAQRDA